MLAWIPITTVFLDDICVTGPNDAEYLTNMEEVLKRLDLENLRINPKKMGLVPVLGLLHRVKK